MLRSTNVILLTGYAGTGKDTFFKTLTGKEKGYEFLVYAKDFSYDFRRYTFRKKGQFNRIGLADILKEEVEKIYNIPHDYQDKNSPVFEYEGEKVSARDMWIIHGKDRRDEDIDYWCKKATIDPDCVNIVTDWRFFNELKYWINLCPITARIFRSEVPEPPLEKESEHQLDDVRTDILIVTSHKEFRLATKRFGYGEDYKLIFVLK